MGRIRCGVVWCGQGRSGGGVYIKCTISDRLGIIIGMEFSSFLPSLLYGVDLTFIFVARVNWMGPLSLPDFDINAPTRIR